CACICGRKPQLSFGTIKPPKKRNRSPRRRRPNRGKKAMCGIAGIIDLADQRPVPEEAVRKMARAIIHRGPDEEGFYFAPGIGLASRRLSIVGLADGQQPVTNEDRS